MKYKNKIILSIFCLFLPILLLLLSYEISLYFTELQPNQEQTIKFLQYNRALTMNYTSAELSHLQDVKRVMNWTDYIFYGLSLIILLMVIYLITYLKKEKQLLYQALFYGGITTVVATLLVLFVSYFLFQQAFTFFHLIFFPQGNWIFPVDSLLIQTFPEQFFLMLGMKIFIGTVILGIVCAGTSMVFQTERTKK